MEVARLRSKLKIPKEIESRVGTPASTTPIGPAIGRGTPTRAIVPQPTSMAVTLDDVRRVVSDAVTEGLGTIGGLKIDKYDGRISWDAIEWLDEYIDLTTVKNWTDINRFRNFGHFLTNDAKNWYRLYVTKATNPPSDWDELKNAFLDYHVPKDKDKKKTYDYSAIILYFTTFGIILSFYQ